jgi:DNA-binding ferritin-like protein
MTHYRRALKIAQDSGDQEAEQQVRDQMRHLEKQAPPMSKPARKR